MSCSGCGRRTRSIVLTGLPGKALDTHPVDVLLLALAGLTVIWCVWFWLPRRR
jgi:hypothetical protein